MKTIDAIRIERNGIQYRTYIKHDPEYDIYELWIYFELEQEPRYKRMYKTYRGVKAAFGKALMHPEKKYFRK